MLNIKKIALYIISVILLVSITSCINNTNVEIIQLISPENNAQDVKFGKVVFEFYTPYVGSHRIVVREGTKTLVDQQINVTKKGQNNFEVGVGIFEPSKTYTWYVEFSEKKVRSSNSTFKTKQASAPRFKTATPQDDAENQSFGTLGLQWEFEDDDDDIEKYELRVWKAFETKPNEGILLDKNSYVLTGLSQSTPYKWEITAIDFTGNKVSKELEFWTKENSAPTSVQLTEPRNGSGGQNFNNLRLSWIATDPDGEELDYDVFISRDQQFTDVKQIFKTKETTKTVDDLDPKTTYYVKIKATDPLGLSAESPVYSFTTKDNTPPPAPEYISPEYNSIVNPAYIKFTWKSVIDPDEDEVGYKIEIYNSSTPTTNSLILSNTADQKTYFEYDSKVLQNRLQEEKTYYWRVVSYEKERPYVERPGQLSMFRTRKANNPPTKPHTPTPANGSTNHPNNVVFSWKAEDPDGDTLTYSIYIGEVPDKSKLSKVKDLESQTFTITGLKFATKYYWYVKVSDEEFTVESDLWDFTVSSSNEFPTKPVLISPSNYATDQEFNNLSLTWSRSTDKETPVTQLKYHVYFGRADDIKVLGTTQLQSEESDRISYNLPSNLLAPLKTYYWRVEVEDEFGNIVSSDTYRFETKSNSAPYMPTNPSPTHRATNVSTNVTITWSGGDPDGDEVTYEIYISPVESLVSNLDQSVKRTRTEPSYEEPGGLQPNTKYYWRIVSKDRHGLQQTSPIWEFTTGSN